MAKSKAANDAKPWDRPRAQSYQERKIGTVDTYRRFLIICEGTETEPNYFREFRAVVRGADIKVRGLGKDPVTLVRKAKGYREQEEARQNGTFDEVWCVFDLDDFGETFNKAIREAKVEGFEVAFSNPCVELWFCLHFRDIREIVTREQLSEWLAGHLKRPYSKNDPDLFRLLWSHNPRADKRASALVENYRNRPGGLNPAVHNPVTRLHELIRALAVNLRT